MWEGIATKQQFVFDVVIVPKTNHKIRSTFLIRLRRNTTSRYLLAKLGRWHYVKHPIKNEIVVYDRTLEQVQHFNYLKSYITFNSNRDVDFKLQRFQTEQCEWNNYQNGGRDTRIRFYRNYGRGASNSLFVSESWVMQKKKSLSHPSHRNEIYKIR